MTEQEFEKLLKLQEEGYAIVTCVNRYIGYEIVSLDEEMSCIYTSSNNEEGDEFEDFDFSNFLVYKNVTGNVL
tara:strand:- start:1256 stop:1474 length:219 start_codon:yes stop_codon:yes gene_type:complete